MIKLELEQSAHDAYRSECAEVDFRSPAIQQKVLGLFEDGMTEIEIIQRAFLFVRDEIDHSWDIQSTRVTRTASETLAYGEGICYAKSNLLAALLRAKQIPTGFCYQRLTLGDTPDTGYCLHALNAVYLSRLDRWIRLDARGNKTGIDAKFAIDHERLAFVVRAAYGEIDYPVIYTNPNPKTMETLRNNRNCIEMYLHELPTEI